MPPWKAVKGFGEFKNDRGLKQEENSFGVREVLQCSYLNLRSAFGTGQ